uniref:Peptidyl-prolyl cis-trans isomerase n=1 Tax=Prevotella sp. GTC17260 TaxID=3236796 RepID=A0AB33JF78_9BACT
MEMRKLADYIVLLLLAVVFGLTSCKEGDDNKVEEFPNWETTNTTYFNTIYQKAKEAAASGDTSWKVFKSYTFADNTHNDAKDHIVVKVQKAGTGTVSPLYTDSVRIHYQGRLLPSTSYSDGYIFDQSWVSGYEYDLKTMVPIKMLTSDLVDGFSTALMHMHLGDRWTVYIPYQLGYGTSATSAIPAYSTLVFDITLVGIYRAGQVIPPYRLSSAKKAPGWIE